MFPHGWPVHAILWDRDREGTKSIIPFLTHAVRPNADSYISPTCITPRSILLATTQRLLLILALHTGPSRLHLPREWVPSPFDHLLSSVTSDVFKSTTSWDAEVVRSTHVLKTLLLKGIRNPGKTDLPILVLVELHKLSGD